MTDDAWAELRADVAVLQLRQRADRELWLALALALVRAGTVSGEDLLEVLKAAQAVAAFAEGAEVAKFMQGAIDSLAAYPNPADIDPIRVMAARALYFADAGRRNREAAATWATEATPDEFSSELRALYDRLAPERSPQKPAKSTRRARPSQGRRGSKPKGGD